MRTPDIDDQNQPPPHSDAQIMTRRVLFFGPSPPPLSGQPQPLHKPDSPGILPAVPGTVLER